MNMYPSAISTAMSVCALRFCGYEYEISKNIAAPVSTGVGLSALSNPVVQTLQIHPDQNDNFGAFFILQRFLHKWGGERLTRYSNERIAYDFLFLHLYAVDTPPEFSDEKYTTRWRNDYLGGIEKTAAFVRKTFRRVGEGPTHFQE